MGIFYLKQSNKWLEKLHLLHVIYVSDSGLSALYKLSRLIFKTRLRCGGFYIYVRHIAGSEWFQILRTSPWIIQGTFYPWSYVLVRETDNKEYINKIKIRAISEEHENADKDRTCIALDQVVCCVRCLRGAFKVKYEWQERDNLVRKKFRASQAEVTAGAKALNWATSMAGSTNRKIN